MKTAVLLVLAAGLRLGAQSPDVIYDEARVPKYTLPDVLAGVKDRAGWEKQRSRILEMYREDVFGRSPARPAKLAWDVGSVDRAALGGKALRKIVTIYFGGKSAAPRARMLMYLPAAAKKPVPVVLGLSFAPIQSVANDPGVPLGDEWVKEARQPGQEKSRGTHAQQWQVDEILKHGYWPGRDLLRRYRAGFQRRHEVRSAAAVLQGGADRAGA